MAKPIPKLKGNSGVRKKHPKNKSVVPVIQTKGWMVAGFDTATSSIAGAAIAYDSVMRKFRGPEFIMRRWAKDDDYLDRLGECAKSHEWVLQLQHQLGISLEVGDVWIAQEEPFPAHGSFMGKGNSNSLKQQAEISGAFMGGLNRYGYKQTWQIGNYQWRGVIADDLGITIHHSKWKDPALCELYHCRPGDTGKFRAKQWAFDINGIAPALAQLGFPGEIPDWPDIIESSKLGKIPRPETSHALAVQPDDRYDALAMMIWLWQELTDEGGLKTPGLAK